MTVTAMPQAPATPADETAPPRSRKKMIIALVAVLALVAGGYYFLKPKPEGPPEPGEVVKLESIQVNLASAHYLRLGIALQMTAEAHEADGSKALDTAIGLFSGLSITEVNDPARREELKKALEKKLGELYHHEVMGVYFTEYVTQ